MTIKKILLILTILIIGLLSTSCREQEDLGDIGIILATGLDFEEDQVILTMEVVIPLNRIEESGEPSSIILQEKGDSVMEAIRNVTLNFDRKLFFSHNLVVIFGEDLAKDGIVNYLDFFTRDSEPRESAFLIVAKDAKAYELMGINSSLSGTGGEYIQALIENSRYTLKSRALTVNEFFKYYYDHKAPLLSIIQIREIADIDHKTGEIGKKDILDARGGAIFYMDKLLGYYSPEEIIGFNFLIDDVEEGVIVFEVPMEFMEESKVISDIGKNTTFELVKSKTKKTVEIIDGKIHLSIDVNAKGLIIEDNRGLDITKLHVRDGVEMACSEKIKEYIGMTIEKAQEYKTDNFGINQLFKIAYPDEYKKIKDDWREKFSKIEYSIDVDTDIIRTGLTNSPTNTIRGEDY